MVLCGVGAQVVHYIILKNFPYVYFLSPAFLLGVGFIVINHYLAFQYFAAHYYMFSEVSVLVKIMSNRFNMRFLSGYRLLYIVSLASTICSFCFIIS